MAARSRWRAATASLIALAAVAGVAAPAGQAKAAAPVAAGTPHDGAALKVQAKSGAANPAQPERAPQKPHDYAVALARAGHYAEGLQALGMLIAAYPRDPSLRADQVVVLGWAGRYQEATEAYNTLERAGPQPDYVMASAAASFRNLHSYRRAFDLYREGAQRFPANLSFLAGQSLTLTDQGQPANGLTVAQRGLAAHPYSVDLLLAAGYAEMQLFQPVDALRYYDSVIRLDPQNREATRARIFAVEAMGAPQVALRLAERHPNLVSRADRRRLHGSEAAQLIRFGEVEPESEDKRFAMTDAAIAQLDRLITEWGGEGPEAAKNIERARLDRIVAYRDRVRMWDVLAEYNALRAQGVDIPPYVLEAVGDAYLYLRQPNHSRHIYEEVLRQDPGFFDAKIGLFYSLIETEHFEEAISLIDKADADEPKWVYIKGAAPLPNPARESADRTAAEARLEADDFRAAEQRFAALAAAAPGNPGFLGGLANVYEARGWFRRAREEYELADALAPHDTALSVDTGENDLALRRYMKAMQRSAELSQKFPERADVQRLARDLDLYNRAELDISIDKSWQETSGVQGGPGLTFDAKLFSPPLAYNWRLFAEEFIGHQEEPDGEGNVTLRAPGAGVEYRAPGITATGTLYEGTYGVDRGGGTTRLGGDLAGTLDLSDQWSLGAEGSIFSRETPLRALRQNITANLGSVSATWRESEQRQDTTTFSYMPFSDGNQRFSLGNAFQQRLYTSPHIKIDGLVDLGVDRNTAANRPYFNPRLDFGTQFGAQAEQILYRRYEFQWSHRLTLTAGPYIEQDYGSSLAWKARYEHRLATSNAFDVGVGVDFGRQSYDGRYQNDADLTLNLHWKF